MRIFRIVVALLALLAIVAGFRMWSQRRDRVRLAYPPMMGSLPVFVAEDQQLFAKEGVRAETVSFSSSNDMVNALVAGQVDVLPAVSLVPLVHLEIQHPGRIRIFSHSRMRPENSTYRIVVKREAAAQNVGDLEGKKIGVFPGTSAAKLLGAFLQRKGVDPRKVTFVQLPPAAQVSSLESGAVDALFSYDPLVAMMPGKYRTLSNSVYAELIEPCPLGVSVISREFERRKPRTAARAVRVVQEGIEYMGAHPDAARALLPRFTRMTADVAARVNVADVTLSNEVDVSALQRFIDLLYEIGEIPQRIDAHRLVDTTR